jgi:translocation and assembly module TamA
LRWAASAAHADGPGLARAFIVALALLLAAAGPARAQEVPVALAIDGVSGAMLDNVRAYLTIAELAEEDTAPAERVRRAHRQARAEIERALQPFGHYTPTLRLRLDTGEDGWTARYRIEPGPQTRIAALELALTGPGAEEPALRRIIADSALAPGEPLHHAEYSATKRDLIETAVESGYLDAEFRHSTLEVRPQAAEADIRLVLATGPAYHFGEVRVEQTILDKDLVARLVPVATGDRLTSARLLDLQFALSGSDYFQRVNVDIQRARARPLPGAGEDAVAVPVVVQTEPRPPRKYSLGFGYGTDTGARVSAGMEFRHINRHGHRIRTDMLVSEVRQNYGASYQVPIGNVRTDHMTFSGTYQRAELGDGISRKYSLGVSRDRQWHGWQRSLYTRYAIERYEFVDDTRKSRLLTPGISLSRTRTDDPIRVRNGWSVYGDVHGAHEDVLANVSFTQVRTRLQAVFGLGTRVRLLGRVEAGADFTQGLGKLPASERFFAGGDRSVRGYAYQSLAPEQDGEVVGGQYLAAGSVEADLRVMGNWGVAAFYDLGNAANDWPPEPKAGAGGGLRWFSPIGTIRLDYAVPLDDPDRTYRIHFSMGPDL